MALGGASDLSVSLFRERADPRIRGAGSESWKLEAGLRCLVGIRCPRCAIRKLETGSWNWQLATGTALRKRQIRIQQKDIADKPFEIMTGIGELPERPYRWAERIELRRRKPLGFVGAAEVNELAEQLVDDVRGRLAYRFSISLRRRSC